VVSLELAVEYEDFTKFNRINNALFEVKHCLTVFGSNYCVLICPNKRFESNSHRTSSLKLSFNFQLLMNNNVLFESDHAIVKLRTHVAMLLLIL